MNRAEKVSSDIRQLRTLKPIPLGRLPKRPLVSILISNHNYGRYLCDAIESVLCQTYRNFEIVICDDGSTDSSREILQIYERLDSRIKVTRQPNGGQSAALNTAFYRSRGDIICLLDADDVFLADKLRLVVDAFVDSPGSGFAVHKMILVDRNRKYLGEIPCLCDLLSGWQGILVNPNGPRVLPGLPPTSGLSLHRSAAKVLFPLPAGLRAYSDTLIQVLAPLMTPVRAIDQPLSEYRVHGGNIGGVRTFTEGRLRNIVLYEKEIWSAWHRYLFSASSGTPSVLPLPTERAPSLMDYAYARYRSDNNAVKIYAAVSSAQIECLPGPLRWFWRTSLLFPDWLFRRAFDLAYGQTPLKMLMRRVLNAYRKRQSPRSQMPIPVRRGEHATRELAQL